jgi:thiol-disulfide isomerase/thioredoxin
MFLGVFLFSQGIEGAGTSEESLKPGKDKTGKMAALELPIPPSDRDRAYLGLEGSGTFKLNQIKTRILIIEILNTYCPHCQHSAPLVNTLYDQIQERADLKDRIKIIGIGVGDNRDEINLFKQDYQVTFPLIPDQEGDIINTFGVQATPTFIGIRLNDRGLPEKFFFQEGGFRKAPRFLKEIIKQAGLKWEE